MELLPNFGDFLGEGTYAEGTQRSQATALAQALLDSVHGQLARTDCGGEEVQAVGGPGRRESPQRDCHAQVLPSSGPRSRTLADRTCTAR